MPSGAYGGRLGGATGTFGGGGAAARSTALRGVVSPPQTPHVLLVNPRGMLAAASASAADPPVRR